MYEINSKNNNKIKDLIKLRDDSKFRNDKSLFYVEGERIICDTPNDLLYALFVKKSKLKSFSSIINKIDEDIVYIVNDEIFDKIKDTTNSQGIIGIVKYNIINSIDNSFLNRISNCLILDNVSDPGNLGTIIRLAEATNIALIILCNDCCNVYNTKVIRSCMSSIFRTNIYISKDIISDINLLKKSDFKIYSTVLDVNSKHFNKVNYNNKSAFVFGNEANGINNKILEITDEKIFIPMCGSIQSLNVASAVTVICYEYMRQNNYYET